MAARNPQQLNDSILRTLLYYDIFSYPLSADEVYRFLPTNGVTENEVRDGLFALADQSVIFPMDRFYSMQNKPELSVRRLTGNAMALQCMEKARRRALLIAKFPFVRSVMISGSMSKGYMDENSDVDFFIVTAPARLWIARMSLVVFKRIFLFNSHKYFCVNYFVDTDHLEIDEKNLFTATELATLLPVVNPAVYDALITRNEWLRSYFPNYTARPKDCILPEQNGWTKRLLESTLNFFFAGKIDAYFREKTLNRWKKLYERHYGKKDFDVAFKTSDHVSKNHPRNYQRKVIDQFEQKVAAMTLNSNP